MRPVPTLPRVHLFVCVNRREPGSPLGEGCGAHGDAVYARLKSEVAQRGAYAAVWVTRAQCLGICPKKGCTVAVYPKQEIVADVEPQDAAGLFARAVGEVGR